MSHVVASGDWHETRVTLWLALPDAAGFASPGLAGGSDARVVSRDALDRTVGDLATAPGFASYLAYRDGVVAGAGSMGICDGVAQLCGAATAPVYPRRGIQTALLSSRLADAARQGCDIAVVTTQPGSKSQQNVQRRGFELLYTRAILVREP